MKVLRLWDRSPQGWAREAGVEETPGSSCQKSCAVQPRLEEQHPPLFPIWDQLAIQPSHHNRADEGRISPLT
ncbi:hypothetical protein Y1Q_0010617 [Alligator mississippiensis]|uniref:Uncharacterized protein n=1 Tax=Alligator mississippiensis TaxID=8496 RepID=A0A151PH17_ALLMI|nr:hypothetical protein Y1Q_0010617 [Alligator mississippiensis]